jgi:nucleotide-binding universal stress UspA family protein
MAGFRRILCATDLSDAADWSIRAADREARLSGAELVLLHVVPMVPGAPMTPALTEETLLNHERLSSDIIDVLLERVERLTGRDAGTVSVIVEDGAPGETIVAQADLVGADLIVVGTHHHGIFGGVVESVVKRAHVSVLVARPGAETGRIVLATDFSGAAAPAIQLAADEAVRRCSTVIAVHSVELVGPEMALGDPPMMMPIAVFPLREMREAAQRRLEDALVEAGIPGEEIEVTEGPPADAIVEVATRRHADLIVVGTSGSTGIDRLLLGSVARRVVREAPCAVLVARPPSVHRHQAEAVRHAPAVA